MGLLNNNRSSSLNMKGLKKYLLYGIGEIILVVIGILIAVNINNWNENKKDIKIAEEYLSSVALELERDTHVFESVLQRIDAYIDYKKIGLESYDLDTFSAQWFEVFVNSSYYNIQINDETFNRMKDDDVLGIEEYRDLFRKINKYYIYHQDYLNNFNEWDVEMSKKEATFWEEQGDFEIDFGTLDSIPIMQNPKIRVQKMRKRYATVKGRNYAKLSLIRLQSVRKIYTTQNNKAIELLELLNDR